MLKAEAVGRTTIRFVNHIVNYTVLTIILLLVAFAAYSLWDSKQIYKAADKEYYAVYKPSAADEGTTFVELQAKNPEVIAWLSVYGTSIDYPVTQGEDNMKYVNTNAEGLYSLSGSIFLDERNSRDFMDFNNILYGHHMEKQAMFGEIGDFSDKRVFDSHLYGNLYACGKDRGIEFFAFLRADAYDRNLFMPLSDPEDQGAYLEAVLRQATYARDIGVTANDRIILLSTCSSSSTNGRDILVGRITDEAFADLFAVAEKTGAGDRAGAARFVNEIPYWILLIIFAVSVWLIVKLARVKRRLKNNDSEIRTGIRKWVL